MIHGIPGKTASYTRGSERKNRSRRETPFAGRRTNFPHPAVPRSSSRCPSTGRPVPCDRLEGFVLGGANTFLDLDQQVRVVLRFAKAAFWSFISRLHPCSPCHQSRHPFRRCPIQCQQFFLGDLRHLDAADVTC